MMATTDLNTLEPFRYVKEYKAHNGQNGASNRRKGADGKELVVKVPVGTLVKVENERSKVKSYDLIKEGQKVLVAKGGEGGRGNSHLRDEFGRRPFRGEKGETGEKVELELELKLIADVGLIGLPNVGKSTLIAALTSATPKVADYPFTTLEPNLGVLNSLSFMVRGSSGKLKKENKNHEQLTTNDSRLVIADIPGLIEGASQGRGLGDLFLRHIQRTKILVHLVDVSEKKDLWQVYQEIRLELKNYSKELVKKKEIIVLNKIDLVDKNRLEEVMGGFKSDRKKVIPISAKTGENLDKLIREIYRRLG